MFRDDGVAHLDAASRYAANLSAEEFEAARERGQRMTKEEAIALVADAL